MISTKDFKFSQWGILLLAILLFGCQSTSKKKVINSENPDLTTQADSAGFVSIFDGKTLTNWDGDSTYWRVENGNLVGEIIPATLLKNNSFIIWRGGEPTDFELKADFRITEMGNSGINYRSDQLDTIPFALRGYQADIDGQNRYTGQNYEERKRTTLAYRGQKTVVHAQPNPDQPGSFQANVKNNAWQSFEVEGSLGDPDSLNTVIKNEDWNECHLIVKGNHMQHFVNDVLMSEVTDEDTINRRFTGLIGVQVHVGPPMKVEYRNIRLKELK